MSVTVTYVSVPKLVADIVIIATKLAIFHLIVVNGYKHLHALDFLYGFHDLSAMHHVTSILSSIAFAHF